MNLTNHFVTLFVNWTGLLAEMDFGSALATARVYMSENLGNLEDTMSPVLLKDPCMRQNTIKFQNSITSIMNISHINSRKLLALQ